MPTELHVPPAAPPDPVFPGDSVMAARCRALDWAATPLGPVAGWPACLRATVATLLTAPRPMILFWGPARVQLYNDAYIPALGSGRHPAALGARGAEFWAGAVSDIVGGQLDAVVSTGVASWHADAYIPLPRNGRVEDTYWSYSYSPVHDAAGRVAGVLDIAEETTARVLAERDLRAASVALAAERERLRGLLLQMPAPVALLEGPEHRHVLVNDAYRRITRGGTDVTGLPLAEAFPEVAGQGFFEQVDAVYATGIPWVARERPFRYDRDGTGVQDAWFDVRLEPVRAPRPDGAPGPVIGVLNAAVDVTDAVRARRAVEAALAESESARQALAESEARFRAVEDASPDGSVLMRPMYGGDGDSGGTDPASSGRPGAIADFAFVYVNPAATALLGPMAERLVGQTLCAVYPDSPTNGYLAGYARAFETGAPFEVEEDYSRFGRPVHLTMTAVRAGALVHARFADVTEAVTARAERERLLAAERSARAEAEAANRAKSEFLAVMSHELRTPLNAIGGYAELMELGIRGPVTAEQRTDLEKIQRAQRHLLGLINGVLNYARMEAGAVHYHLEDVVLDEVLAACEALVAPQLRARGLTLQLRLPARTADDGAAGGWPLRVCADREKVQQVVLNLLSNAIKFTEPGGHVTLSSGTTEGAARVVVADSGIGIADDQLARAFEPFVQVDARLTRTRDGTGLGLAISRDLARGMGGDLTAESTPGAGSTFTLTLPRA